MNTFALRIDATALKKFQQLNDLLTIRCYKVIASLENTGKTNEHAHYMIQTIFSLSTIRKDIQNLIVSKGNKSYSLKQNKDKEHYKTGKRYIMKGTAKNKYLILMIKGYTLKQAKKYNNEYWVKFSRLKQKHKNKGTPIFKQIYNQIKDDIDQFYCSIDCTKYCLDWMAEKIEYFIRLKCIRWYIKNNKCYPNKYALRSVSLSVLNLALTQIGHFKGSVEKLIYALLYPEDKVVDLERITIDIDNNLYIPSPL